jgi:hypothetical protein
MFLSVLMLYQVRSLQFLVAFSRPKSIPPGKTPQKFQVFFLNYRNSHTIVLCRVVHERRPFWPEMRRIS